MDSKATMIALDTNLLVYAHMSATGEHDQARRAIEKALGLGLCGISLFSVSEFWGIVTQSRPGKSSSSPDQASAFIRPLSKLS